MSKMSMGLAVKPCTAGPELVSFAGCVAVGRSGVCSLAGLDWPFLAAKLRLDFPVT